MLMCLRVCELDEKVTNEKQKVQSRGREALNYYKSFLVSLHNVV